MTKSTGAREEERETRILPAIGRHFFQDIDLEHIALSRVKFIDGEVVLEVEGHDSDYRLRSFKHPSAFGYDGLLLRNGLPVEKSVAILIRDREQRFDLLGRLEENPDIIVQIASNPDYQGRRVSLHQLLGDDPYIFDATSRTLTLYGKTYDNRPGLVTFHSRKRDFARDVEASSDRAVPKRLVSPNRFVAYGASIYSASGQLVVTAQTSQERFSEFGIRVLTPAKYHRMVERGKLERVVYIIEKPVDREI